MESLLTAKEVAKLLNCSVFFVAEHVETNDRPAKQQPALKAVRLGKQRLVRFKPEDVQDFVNGLAAKKN